MKILIATDSYKFNMSGVTASILALCAGLRRCGHEVKTMSPSDCRRSYRNGDDYYIKSIPVFYYPDMRFSFSINDPLVRELEDWEPDVIHIQTEGSAQLMSKRIIRHCKASVVMSCHTDYAYFLFGRLRSFPPVKAFMRSMGRIMYRDAVKIIAPSQKARDFSILRSLQDRVTVIPNGIELEKYQKTLSAPERHKLRSSLGIDDSTKVMVAVSRMSREKNIRELISFLPSVLKRLPDVKLLLVGDGPDRRQLEKLVERLQLRKNTVFAGPVPSAEVWRYYAAGDVFVSASTFEVHSMSYLEALAQGLPLLCRADDALAGVLEHGLNGMIYHSREEFTAHACKLLGDDGTAEEMGQSSLQKAAEFSSDRFADAVLRLYENAIRENNKKAVLSA